MTIATYADTTTMTLTEAINQHHRQAVAGYSSALEHAVAAGCLLTRQKNELTHGAWLPWLQQNFDGSARIAQRYMQLAAAPELEEASAPTYLTIEQALEHVSVPRPKRATASDAGAMLQGLVLVPPPSGDATGVTDTAAIHGALEAAGNRPAFAFNDWTSQQERKRVKARDLLNDAHAKMDDASAPDLSSYSRAATLREAAIKARQAASELDALAFSFES